MKRHARSVSKRLYVVPLAVVALALASQACGERESSSFARPDPPPDAAGAECVPTKGHALGAGEKVPLRIPDESTIPKGPLGEAVLRGNRLATATYEELPANVGNSLHCSSCHLGGGTVAGAAPWVGLAGMFPEYRARSGEVATLEDRVNDCFERSMNGKRLPAGSRDMTAIVAYITWLSRDVPLGHAVEGRGFDKMANPPTANKERGKQVYSTKCTSCHGDDGLGKPAGNDYQFPPLWGDRSFNVGAGMARLDTAAAFVKAKMPLGSGNTLTEQDAYDVAAYFTTMPRPDFAGKAKDWPKGDKPKDARY